MGSTTKKGRTEAIDFRHSDRSLLSLSSNFLAVRVNIAGLRLAVRFTSIAKQPCNDACFCMSKAVLARMGSNNKQTDEKLTVNTSSRVTFCQRNKSENGSFVSNLRNHFHEFIHASVDEHKRCLRNTIQKIFLASKIFGKNGDSTNEGENSVPLQSSTRN
ncbi:hypothetical protein VNO77_40696 [Canavalia gladiata]|uniref:Uncharacterized protein n=1 Tax=Canavalia gladiata TaxID=3824 RepID=A0AAN9PPQ8_CANGL